MSGRPSNTNDPGLDPEATLGRTNVVAISHISDTSSSSSDGIAHEKLVEESKVTFPSHDASPDEPEWKWNLLRELETFTTPMSSADAIKCSKRLGQFFDLVLRVIDELEIMEDSITTLFSQSTIASSSGNTREILVALAYRFASGADTRFAGSDMTKFVQKFRHRLGPGTIETTKSATGQESLSDSDAQRSSNKLLRYPARILFDLLNDSLTYLSKDLKTFTYYMKVSTNSEMDKVQVSIVNMSVFCRPWTKLVNPNRSMLSPIYEHEVMYEISPLLESLSDTLGNFLIRKNGLPAIKEQHEKSIENESLVLLSVSTFLSAVTAATLALSASQNSPLYDVVNFFWFTSLVFSIASVLNSLLALTWKHSIFRTRAPDEQLPLVIALWSRKSPFYFLAFAAVCFIIGLCLLAFASSQPVWTSAITTILTCFSVLGLAIATAWFVVERHHYEHRKVNDEEVGLHTAQPFSSSSGKVRSAPMLRQHSSIKGAKTHATMDNVIGALKSIKAQEFELEENLDPVLGISYSLDGKWIGITRATQLGLYSATDHVLLQAITPEISTSVTSYDQRFRGYVIWSPVGDRFLLRTSDGVQVWEKDGPDSKFHLTNTVSDYLSDESDETFIVWLPSGEAFSRISGSSVKSYYKGTEEWCILSEGSLCHTDPNTRDDLLVVSDVVVTGESKDTARMLIATKSSSTMRDINSTTLRGVVQHELIVFDVNNHKVESRIPLFDFARTLCLSKNKKELLIGYADMEGNESAPGNAPADDTKHLHCQPLQLWELSPGNEGVLRLHLVRLYEYPSRTNFSETCCLSPNKGEAFFCGSNDFLVACLDRKKNVFQVWEKNTSVHLCAVNGGVQDAGLHIKSIAVNRAHPTLMFVTEESDGTILTWSRAKRDAKQEKKDLSVLSK